jgi:large subunit GTPase 1
VLSRLVVFRCLWADYFDQQGIQYAFFSALNATALQQARQEALAQQEEESRSPQDGDSQELLETPDAEDSDADHGNSDEDSSLSSDSYDEDSTGALFPLNDETTEDGRDPRAHVLSVLELEDLFTKAAPKLEGKPI